MPEKLKIHWVTQTHGLVGNALGYNQHNSAMLRFSDPYIDMDPNADIALSVCPADFFVPVAGKTNVLFTMWESPDLPNNYLQRISRADALIVPCTFCRELMRPYFHGPIFVCHEGVDPDKFQYHERRMPRAGENFRFLWVGAMNPRKGYGTLIEIADKIIQRLKGVELYIKTTTPPQDRKNFLTKLWAQRREIRAENPRMVKEMLRDAKNPDVSNKLMRMGPAENIIWDSRLLSSAEMISLYESANCFLFPTFGEGWGLTLCEAMATGLPAIAPPVTGCADYFDDVVGYTVKSDLRYTEFKNYHIISRVFCPDTNDVAKRMLEVIKNYPEALRRGRRASNRILTKFTWQKSAERLRDILIEIQNKIATVKISGG